MTTAALLAAMLAAPGSSDAVSILSGACCDVVNGCCASTGGSCQLTTSNVCEFGYKGDGTTCEQFCPVTSTTTTTLKPTTTTTSSSTTSTSSTSTSTLPAGYVCGDANEDGKVTAPDALIALKTAVGSDQCVLSRCDFNGDAKVSATDALAILKVAVGQPLKSACPPPL